ncbi:hypothetical protein HCC61_28030 [Streptomyces sp. HNM0575]|uniref:hypothetical protein n=1 Tax=Streptomyces sp. HNM0575 TaxID=2716338 RepID=UPI00145D3C6C|nr:hypothetical protein [Streptomyces sp. HNM0575]NLU76426.1 hypothetical protein [Streptomyces sp. HNM0575]
MTAYVTGAQGPLGPVTDAVRKGLRTAGAAHASSSPATAVRTRPRADCTADSAGGLTFDIRLDDGAPASPLRGDGALLLRLRRGEGPSGTVRLPLGPAEAEGVLRAVLPSIMSLPEGRWDAYLVLGGDEPRRLLPGVHDLRSLIDRVPREGRTWLGVRIPYATKYGNLTVRSWLRWPHAEAGPLEVGDGGVALRGRLYGARLSDTATLEARPRGGGEAPVSVPLLRDDHGHGGGHGHGYGREPGHERGGADGQTAEGGRTEGGRTDRDRADGDRTDGDRTEGEGGPPPGFTARLPLELLPYGDRVWNLWVRPSAEEEPVRLARILDDVPDKKQIFSYPPQRVTAPCGAVTSVRPYYTRDNDLSVRVTCAEPV